jgi:murein L,D-transpeptidase YcbB/YkuD
MSQNNNNRSGNNDEDSGNNDEDKRLKSFGYSFSAISFVVFIYVLLFPVEKELKQQAIYWFASSFIAAVIPNVKQFKIKDIEVQLQGISKKIEENKNLIEQKNEELRDDLFLSLESVRKNEESLSEDYRTKREQGYQRYANKLEKLTPDRRLKEQNKFTVINLIDIGMSISDLKKMLQKAGFYKGGIDEIFNEQLAQSIGDFQQKHGVLPVDGTAGPKTLSKLSEIIGSL